MNQERFQVTYSIVGDEKAAREKAEIICLEQTVELDDELIPEGLIRDHIIGKLEQFFKLDNTRHAAVVSYAIETSAFELTQLLNLIFGNTSIKAQIRVEDISLSECLLKSFSGPRFGISKIRSIIGVQDTPLLCSALKPMGKTPSEIADLAYQFALGGVDIVKDDHGLSNQSFCPFNDRVEACVEAVEKANRKTGRQSIYAPNITAPATEIIQRALFAKNAGAGALLVAPGLTGFDTMRAISADDRIQLPIISHPSLLGAMVVGYNMGFSHEVLFGIIQRLAGADASIYPNYGGRFGFTREECGSIAKACQKSMGNYPAIFPTPGGGMTLNNAPDMLAFYGCDVMFLIGGGLYQGSEGIINSVRSFLNMIGR